MSSIYMLKQDVRFDNSNQMVKKSINHLYQQQILSFPSNVIGCALMIANLNTLRVAYGGTDHPTIEINGSWNSFGAGIDDVAYVGHQVYFTAWIELICRGGNGVDDWMGFASPQASYLTIQAIARCE